MGKQRMAGYTPLKGAPEPIGMAAGGVAHDETAPAPVRGAAAPSVADATHDRATAPGAAAGPEGVTDGGSEAGPAEGPSMTGVPYEQRQRMAGYTPLRGASPGAAPAAAVGTGSPGGAQHEHASSAAEPGEVAAGTVPEPAPSTDRGAALAAPESQAESAARPDAQSAAPTGQRMKGYTPLKRPAVPQAPASTPDAGPTAAASATTASSPAEARPASAAPKQRMGGQQAAPHAAAAGATTTPSATKPSATKPSTTTSPAKGEASVGATAETSSSRRRLLVTVASVVLLALVAVLAARGLRTLEPVQQFIAQYDGHPRHPESAPIGLPAWLGWQHFLNMFLMVLIIRTGLQIRREQRPPAHFTPKENSLFSAKGAPPKKYSLTIWTHQALDLLWLLNGVVFVVLLFLTGQWMRIIPTDPFVFHHALSAGLQYLSLDWPAENGWVHYNALQMISYTLVVFVAAPLAALTGWRMSSWFPANSSGLAKAFPMEAARRVHFPVLLFFIGFLVVHVFLVLFTGLTRNLNYMYTGRDSADVWGLIVFLVSVAVIAVGWFFLKPQFLAPVASKFGTVGR